MGQSWHSVLAADPLFSSYHSRFTNKLSYSRPPLAKAGRGWQRLAEAGCASPDSCHLSPGLLVASEISANLQRLLWSAWSGALAGAVRQGVLLPLLRVGVGLFWSVALPALTAPPALL